MANSVVTVTVIDHASMSKYEIVFGTIAIAAGDYPTGGLTLDFSDYKIKSNSPGLAFIQGAAGYQYVYIPGATKNVGKLMIRQVPPAASLTNAAPLEQVATTTPTAVVNDDILFVAIFALFL